jgi:4-amino-4-deoxy-L-arabinose transferase-like glycosyltransferase
MRQRKARPAPPVPRRRAWWPHLLIAAAIALVYANSLRGPFVFDDRATIIDNGTIEDLGTVRVLRPPHETSVAGRPVANVSFAINYALGGRDVTGYHAVNITIHVLCALAIFGIARRLVPSEAALAIALLWGLHPLASEAVDYLTQRTESLMALCYLTTVYCAIRAAERPERASRWTLAAVAACALGMGTKETMVTAPIAVALFDRVYLFPSFTDALRRRAMLYAGLAATWLLLAAAIWHSPRGLSAGFGAYDANVATYLLNQAVMIVRYLRLAVWPSGLVLYYGWPLPLTVGAVLPQLVAVAALIACAVWALWRHPRVGVLGVFFILALAPTSSIVPIATEVGAERRMYLPLVAIVALAVIGVRRFVAAPRARLAALAVIAMALGAVTAVRNAEYRSSLRLAETTAERWPSPAADSMFGVELAAAGRLPEAEGRLRAAAAAGYPPARYYLGTVLVAEHRPAEAVDPLRSFIESQPSELEQVRLARTELAIAYRDDGRDGDAAAAYRAVLKSTPGDTEAMVQLSQILLEHERFAEAIPVLQQLTAQQPGNAWGFGGLGIALASTGQIDAAVDAFRRQVELEPANEHARQNLTRALSMRGK